MKAVVVDLDGTLLRSDKSISERTLRALADLETMGIKFIIATARPPRCVFQLFPFDFTNLYTICYNGAEIYRGDKLIWQKYIDAVDAKTIIDWLNANCPGTDISIEINDHLYANFDISIMKGWLPPYTQVDFGTFDFRPAAKILVNLACLDGIYELKNMLPHSCAMLVTDGGTLGQIAHKDISKLNSVKTVAKMLGCDIEDMVAFGDDFNDIEMLRECVIGVAMGNAPPEVKEAADIIAATNDEDGVAIDVSSRHSNKRRGKLSNSKEAQKETDRKAVCYFAYNHVHIVTETIRKEAVG